jgi:glycosyltransferase involved in cell wall biosynthesis
MSVILFNDNLISPGAQRGIARYLKHIVDGAVADLGPRAIVCSSQSRDYGEVRHLYSPRFRGSWRIGLQDKFTTVVAAIARPSVIYNAYYGRVETRTRQVFTVYDMMHELFAPATHPFIAQKRRCLQRASALLAISRHTAQDIQRIYPDIDTAKITITPLGVDRLFFERPYQPRAPVNKPYFLYVGHRTPYKNFSRLLIAFGQSKLSAHFDLRVISPGGASFTPVEVESIHQHGLQGSVQLLQAPSDISLRDAYAAAWAFVYPSTYEGFGLPILEAMASGTLVATANISSMPEVGGDIAFYFDPLFPESIAATLRQVANYTLEQRAQRIAMGIEHARTYTWERCQQQTLNVLRSVM